MGVFPLYKGVEVKSARKIVSKAGHIIGVVSAPMPSTIFLIVNSRCNLKCNMCDVGIADDGSQFWQNMVSEGELAPGLIKNLIDEVKSFKPLIAMTSTEPLLYKPLAEVIEYATMAGVRTQVTTNGFLLEKKADELVKAGLTSLWVSIDGLEPVHDRIRGVRGSFQKVVSGLKKVFEIRKVKNTLKEIGINCSISPSNQGFIFELLEYLSEMPPGLIDVVTLSHMNFITEDMARRHNSLFGGICKATPTCVGEIDPGSMDVDVLWAELEKIYKKRWPFTIHYSPYLKERDSVEAFYKKPEEVVAKKACFIPWDQAQIAANGELIIMTRCFHLPMGNLKDASFKELWNCEKMRSFRKELRRVGVFPACTRCCGVL